MPNGQINAGATALATGALIVVLALALAVGNKKKEHAPDWQPAPSATATGR